MAAQPARGQPHSPPAALAAMIEELEGRVLLTIFPGLTPAQVRHAYGFDQVRFMLPTGTQVAGTGWTTTIAIVDAYDDPNIVQDLATFDQAFGLPNHDYLGNPFLVKAYPGGKPIADPGWSQEISLDVEWAHAIAPYARILLVEAKSTSFSDMLTAVNYARMQSGVVAVSMSWGTQEFATEAGLNGYFLTPAGHIGAYHQPGGVTFVASSGDAGAPPEWPAISSNVLAVGGTTLNTGIGGSYVSETAWSGSGGGFSQYIAKPAYQSKIVSGTQRANPDVAYDADPSSGVSVYDSYAFSGMSGWLQFGGTSAGAPQWSALMAIVAQGRQLLGKNSLDGPTQTLPLIYALPATDFHDITVGSNGLQAAIGYDPTTGRGSPIANNVIRDMVAWGSAAPATMTLSPTSTSSLSATAAALPAGFSISPVIAGAAISNDLLVRHDGEILRN